MKHARRNNDGFTLVELIVVLVILAILAAILVPALLGYIERARGQQLVLNAKSCLTAAQAEFSKMYASDTTWDKSAYVGEKQEAIDIMNTADVLPDCTTLIVGCDTAMTKNVHSGYEITFVYYAEGDDSIYFDGERWVETTEFPTSYLSNKYCYYIHTIYYQ
jgi:prepilin-type N-terminal cleavage/methylation domain-containing protein